MIFVTHIHLYLGDIADSIRYINKLADTLREIVKPQNNKDYAQMFKM